MILIHVMSYHHSDYITHGLVPTSCVHAIPRSWQCLKESFLFASPDHPPSGAPAAAAAVLSFALCPPVNSCSPVGLCPTPRPVRGEERGDTSIVTAWPGRLVVLYLLVDEAGLDV